MAFSNTDLPVFDDELTAERILLRNRNSNDTHYQMLNKFLNGYRHEKKNRLEMCLECIQNKRGGK